METLDRTLQNENFKSLGFDNNLKLSWQYCIHWKFSFGNDIDKTNLWILIFHPTNSYVIY